MSEEKKPSDIIILIAWAQFIAISTAVDKADMRNIKGAWEQASPWMWQWDWTKFGGIATAVNVLALCFLTLPALGQATSLEISEGRKNANQKFYLKLRNLGFYTWLVSFVLFIGYLNFMSVICLYLGVAIVIALALYYRVSKLK